MYLELNQVAMSYVNINRKLKGGSAFDPTTKPDNDQERVAALRRLEIFDTPSEEIFSAYTELAALTFNTPIALMSFVDVDAVHYKQAHGVDRTGQIVPRKNSPCSIAILHNEVTLFRYALTDPCVLADEEKLAEVGYKFYAGAPLVTANKHNIGMLAVVDKKPREYSSEELSRLKQLATDVMGEIEFRLATKNKSATPELNERLKIIHAKVALLRTRA